jgi:hypothetical protein
MLMELNRYPQGYYLLGIDGNPTPKPINDNYMTQVHKKLCRKLKLSEDVKLYNWKRCGVNAAYQAGVGIRAIKKHGRWTSLKDVDIYLEDTGVYDNEEITMKMPDFKLLNKDANKTK